MATDTKSKESTRRPSLSVVAALVIAALVVTAACGGSDDGAEPSLISEGAAAPDFTLPAANDEPVRLSDVITEKSVLLYFSMGSG